jgi:hypothetical protein
MLAAPSAFDEFAQPIKFFDRGFNRSYLGARHAWTVAETPRSGRGWAGCLGPHAILLEELLDSFNSVALFIEKRADPPQQFNVLRPVIAAPAASLERPNLSEFALPEAQDMLRYLEFRGDLADGPKRLRRLAIARTARVASGCDGRDTLLLFLRGFRVDAVLQDM